METATVFETPTERAEFLLPLILDGARVEEGEGTAERHAKTAEMGLWGDMQMLKRDCAVIFAAELREAMELMGWESPELGPGGVLFTAVMAVPMFGRLVTLWRREVEWNMENKVRGLLKKTLLPPLKPLEAEDLALLDKPYEAVHEQLMELAKGWTYLA